MKKPNILLLTLEFPRWCDAAKYTYEANFGLEEGLQAEGVEYLTIPVMFADKGTQWAKWFDIIQARVQGKSFDQVWFEVTHSKFPPHFLELIHSLAPVRLGFVFESMENTAQGIAWNPAGAEARNDNLAANLKHTTHLVVVDEADLIRFNHEGVKPAFWWASGHIPGRLFAKAPMPATKAPAVFHGTLYGERTKWLTHPDLTGLLKHGTSQENATQFPAQWDRLSQKLHTALIEKEPINEAIFFSYVDFIRNARRTTYPLWLKSLIDGVAVVNLPQFAYAYASRVTQGMAAGRPVISFEIRDRPRTRALYENGQEILLYSSDQPAELAEHIQHIQREPAFGQMLARNALAKMRRFHTEEKFVADIIKWIDSGLEPDYGDGVGECSSFASVRWLTPTDLSAAHSAEKNEKSIAEHIVVPSPVSNSADKNKFTFKTAKSGGGDGPLETKVLNELATMFKLGVFIETGTCMGDTVATAIPVFSEIHTIEFSSELAQKAALRFESVGKVHVHHGDSADCLLEILEQTSSAPLIWLHGHYSEGVTARGRGNIPVIDEIKSIDHSGISDAVILIDDLRLFDNRESKAGDPESLSGYPSVQELYSLVAGMEKEYRLFFYGDVALILPASADVQVSPLVAAFTVSRLYDGSNLSIDEVLAAEAVIASTQGGEREALRQLVQARSVGTTEGCGLGLYYRFWDALAALSENAAIAEQQFSAVIKLGFTHWRAKWHLARACAALGKTAEMRGLLTEVLAMNPRFAPAVAMLGNDQPGVASSGTDLEKLQDQGLWQEGQPLRLHLGCGEQHFDGYVNVDYPADQHNVMAVKADYQANITQLHFPPQSVDEIRLHHVFEHFNRVTALAMLIKWQQWLKIGGKLHIETPDLMGSAEILVSNHSWPVKMGTVRHLAGDQAASWAYHVDHWFPERYQHTLKLLGFGQVETQTTRWPQPPHLCNVHAVGIKTEIFNTEQLLVAGDALLWESTVAPVEKPTHAVWTRQLRAVLQQNTHVGIGNIHVADTGTSPVPSAVPPALVVSSVKTLPPPAAGLMPLAEIHDFNQRARDRWVKEKASTVPAGSRVLDMGAGTCLYRPLFAHCDYKTHDFKQYEGAEKHGGTSAYGRIDYVSEILAIPAPDHSFDVILCTEVLEHVPEPIKVLREISRLLRPGGRAFVTAPLGSGLHQLPFHFYGGYTPEWYRRFSAEAGMTATEITPNGGFFKHLAQECARAGGLYAQKPELHGPEAKELYQLLVENLPRLFYGLDDKCFDERFTVGYFVEVNKPVGKKPTKKMEDDLAISRSDITQPVVVKLMGGLGNQMFQYATGLALATKNHAPLMLDLTFLQDRSPRPNFTPRDYALDAFPLNPGCALIRDAQDLPAGLKAVAEKHFHYDASVSDLPTGVVLQGYWQSPRYFEDIAAEVRKNFSLAPQLKPAAKALADQIEASMAVCLHVRRGDMAHNPHTASVHGTCPKEYYQTACDVVARKFPSAQFFIFSDDPAWCKTQDLTRGRSNVVISSAGGGQGAIVDLYLMRRCRHFIIANSTFSWWAAYLSDSPDKTVIAPDPWFSDPALDVSDLLPSGWIRLSRCPGPILPDRSAVPLVSVIVPCYKQAHYLSEAVESVVAQTFSDWEVIVVNDGSPDETSRVVSELIERHPERRIRVIEKANGGLANARNTGIEAAKGAYILPLDADDKLAPDYLAKTTAFLQANPTEKIVTTGRHDFGASSAKHSFAKYTLPQILQNNYISYCTLYRREVWAAVGGYNPNMIWGYEDWNFWIGCAERGWIPGIIPEILFYYRVKTSSMLVDAMKHDVELRAQIILNHPRHFTPALIAKAGEIVTESRKTSGRAQPHAVVQGATATSVNGAASPQASAVATKLVSGKFDTDKCQVFLDQYEKHFRHLADQEVRLLKIGVFRGGSMMMWNDYFKKGVIAGLDLNPVALKDKPERVRIYQGYQQDGALLGRIREECAPEGFDIIIDDASHLGSLSRETFNHLFDRHLKPGGIYVIEDWGTGYWDSWPDGKKAIAGVPHNEGMVGFIKELVDEAGMDDLTRTGRGTLSPARESKFEGVFVTCGQAFIMKKPVPAVKELSTPVVATDPAATEIVPSTRSTSAVAKPTPQRVIALISAYNEGDVIAHVIGDLIANGVAVYLIDNNSTDNTIAEASQWLGKGLLKIERFPQDAGPEYTKRCEKEYVWSQILRRKEELAARLGADWYIHADADEFRESPWPGQTLAEAIAQVDALGYSAINFELLNFRPSDDSFPPGADVRGYLTAYDPAEFFDALQIKAWKNTVQRAQLVNNGGHSINFPGRRVFPLNFILRHYPIRGETHGRRKVFTDRVPRFAPEEVACNWHVQYNCYVNGNAKFLHDPARLLAYDSDAVRTKLLTDFTADVELMHALGVKPGSGKTPELAVLCEWAGRKLGMAEPLAREMAQQADQLLDQLLPTQAKGETDLDLDIDATAASLLLSLLQVKIAVARFAGDVRLVQTGTLLGGVLTKRLAQALNDSRVNEPKAEITTDSRHGLRPLVSICIPTYNGQNFISDAIACVLAQDYPNFELIVSDDASTDRTIELAKNCLKDATFPVAILQHQRLGLVENWNHCLKLAKGKYIKFLFQDDLLEPDCVSALVGMAEQDPAIGLVFSPRRIEVHGGAVADNDLQAACRESMDVHKGWSGLSPIQSGAALLCDPKLLEQPINKVGEPTTVLLARQAIEAAGGFDQNLRQLVDVEMWLRIMTKFKVGFVARPLSCFRLHSKQATQTNNQAGLINDDWRRFFGKLTTDPVFASLPAVHRAHAGKILTRLGGALPPARAAAPAKETIVLVSPPAARVRFQQMIQTIEDLVRQQCFKEAREQAELARELAPTAECAVHAEEILTLLRQVGDSVGESAPVPPTVAGGDFFGSEECKVIGQLIADYAAAPADPALLAQLSGLRQGLVDFLLRTDSAQLEPLFAGDFGSVYRKVLHSGLQTLALPAEQSETFRTLLDELAGAKIRADAQFSRKIMALILFVPAHQPLGVVAREIMPAWFLNVYRDYFQPITEANHGPLVSVIVPCYNQANFLKEAVDSVLAQSCQDWELIIVNDGSPDETSQVVREIIKKNPQRSIQLVEKTNGGLADARNAGIHVAQGKYILPLDADDKIHARLLEKTVAVLEGSPAIGIAYSDWQYFGAEHRTRTAREYDFSYLCNKENLFTCTALFRRQAWAAAGGYNRNMTHGLEDWDFWIGCGEHGFVGQRIPEVLFYYRMKPGSMIQTVRPHLLEMFAQIVLNHPRLYNKAVIEEVKKRLPSVAADSERPQIGPEEFQRIILQVENLVREQRFPEAMAQAELAVEIAPTPEGAARAQEIIGLLHGAVDGGKPSSVEGSEPTGNDYFSATECATITQMIATYTADPANSTALAQISTLRQGLADFLAGAEGQNLETLFIGNFGLIYRAVLTSGLLSEPALEEQQAEDKIRAAGLQQAQIDADDCVFSRVLALMLVAPAHQNSVPLTLEKIPTWFLDDYLAYVLYAPPVFAVAGEAEVYRNHMLTWVRSIYLRVRTAPDDSLTNHVAHYFALKANYIPLYFTPANTKELAEKRAAIMEFVIVKRGAIVNASFPSRSRMGQKIRVGYLNAHFSTQTETHVTLPSLQLDRSKFEICLFPLKVTGGPVEDYCRSFADKFVPLPQELAQQVSVIRQAALDVIIIGTNVTAVTNQIALLALHRLAPLQLVTYCSPVSTGMRHVDGYLSGTFAVDKDAAEHFSEKLMVCDGPPGCLDYAVENRVPANRFDRRSMGIADTDVIFVNAAACFKILPEMQETWAKIIKSVDNSRLLLLPFNPNWNSTFPVKQFTRSLSAAFHRHGLGEDRIMLTGSLPSRAEVKELEKIADVYLDTYPFSGSISVIDPLELGIPSVVWEGKTHRSRMAAALLRELAIPELIAQDERSYIRISVQLATDAAFRLEIKSRILAAMAAKPRFINPATYGQQLGELLGRHLTGKNQTLTVTDKALRKRRESVALVA